MDRNKTKALIEAIEREVDAEYNELTTDNCSVAIFINEMVEMGLFSDEADAVKNIETIWQDIASHYVSTETNKCMASVRVLSCIIGYEISVGIVGFYLNPKVYLPDVMETGEYEAIEL